MIKFLSKTTPNNLCTTAEHFQCEYTPGMHLKEGTTDQYAIHTDMNSITQGGTLIGVHSNPVSPRLSCYEQNGKTFSVVSLPKHDGAFLIPHKPGQYVKTFYVPKIGDIKYDASDADHPLLDLGAMVTVKRLGVILLGKEAIGADDQVINFKTKNGTGRIGGWGTGGNIAIHTADAGKVGLFREFDCDYMSDKLHVVNAAAKNNNLPACLIYAVFEPSDTVEYSYLSLHANAAVAHLLSSTQIDGTLSSVSARFFAHAKVTGDATVTILRSALPHATNVAGAVAAAEATVVNAITLVNLGAIGSAGAGDHLVIAGNADFTGNRIGMSLGADSTDAVLLVSLTAKFVAA